MRNIRIKLHTNLNSRLISVIASVASFALMVLEILLLPWEEIKNASITSSLTLLSLICTIVSLIAVILSVITVVRSELMLKKEKERLMVALSYMKLVNKASEKDEEVQLIIDDLMHFEKITRKEYVNLKAFYRLANDGMSSTEETDIESTIDNVKDALLKISDITYRQVI